MNDKPDLHKTISISSDYGRRLAKIIKSGTNYLSVDGKFYDIVDTIKIGRGASNYIYIDDKMASHQHAEVQKIKNDFLIKDLDSLNGTFVNNILVPPQKYQMLKVGDVIRIGSTEIFVK